MPKLASPPLVAPETWRALIAASTDFAALKPWEFTYDTNAVGLINSATGETRIACVLGNAEEVFAAVFYRRNGLRWILSALSDTSDLGDLAQAEDMDFLKLEFVPKRELSKADLAVLKIANFKVNGKGSVWPQFRSAEPGWHPWHLNQTEADELLIALPRLTSFCKMLNDHPHLFDGRDATEIPFLPPAFPDRPLTPEDLDWRPLLAPPLIVESCHIPADQLKRLSSLKHDPKLTCEFDSTLLPGGSFIENGRPCFGRFSLLVEKRRGLVLGMSVQNGAIQPGEAAGRGLIEALLM